VPKSPSKWTLPRLRRRDLQSLIAAGVTRVSLGGQSFDDVRLAALGRRHRRQDLLEACHWLQESLQVGGLQSWSLDLIRNLPDQGDRGMGGAAGAGRCCASPPCIDLRPQRGARHCVCLA